MPTTVAGDPTNFPDEITIPSDGDGPGIKAADVNVGFEGCADREAYLKARVDKFELAAGVNWITKNNDIGDLRWAHYNTAKRIWYVGGDTENVRASVDWGFFWDASSQIASVGSDEHTMMADNDADGNMVVSTDTRYIFEQDASTSIWTKVDAVGESVPVEPPAFIVYDPVNEYWILGTQVDTPDPYEIKVRRSEDRTTWEDPTTPPTPAAIGADMFTGAIRKDTGRVIFVNPGTTTRFFKSDDGGDVWSQVGTLSGGFDVTLRNVNLVWDPITELWIYTANFDDSGDLSSKIWTSDDNGATWTLKATLTTSTINRVAPFRNVWVGMGQLSANWCEIIYSTDQGATWEWGGMRFNGVNSRGMFLGGGGIAAITTEAVYLSARIGDLSLGTVS